MTKTRLWTMTLFALVVIVSIGGGAGTAAAFTCKTSVTGHGSSVNVRVLGETRARGSWKTAALGAYGLGYQNWILAQQRGESCTRSGPLGHRVYTCEATGKPCKV
ncbi:MAG: hypothetical protein QOF14_1760 [Hyphomicrobiales bacterium]|jgi:hypothetical protein|nr:hypothetical protein [Hyphomicrobiales bacterium]